MKWFIGSLLGFLFTSNLLAQDIPELAGDQQAPKTLWDLFVLGGWAMFPLAGLSIIALMLVFIYLFTLRRGNVVTGRFMETADALLKKRDYLGLLAVSNRHNEAVARITQRMLDFATRNPSAEVDQLKEIAETEGTRQAAAMNQQVTYLADIGMLAPMVGLFGTVVGMIKSFSAVAAEAAAARSSMLAEGVSEALIATAAGLVVGIPAMAFYAYFRGKVQRLVSELEAASTQILSMLTLHYSAPAKRRREQVTLDDEY